MIYETEKPEMSTSTISCIGNSSDCQIFHKEGLYPYQFTAMQTLLESDLTATLEVALFTDEATFTCRRFFDFRNKHARE